MTDDRPADALPLRPSLMTRLLRPLARPGLSPPPWARAALARLERADAVVPLLAALESRRPPAGADAADLPPLVYAPWSTPQLDVHLTIGAAAAPSAAPVVTAHLSPRTDVPAPPPSPRTPAPEPARPVESASPPPTSPPVEPAPLPSSGPRRLVHRPSWPAPRTQSNAAPPIITPERAPPFDREPVSVADPVPSLAASPTPAPEPRPVAAATVHPPTVHPLTVHPPSTSRPATARPLVESSPRPPDPAAPRVAPATPAPPPDLRLTRTATSSPDAPRIAAEPPSRLPASPPRLPVPRATPVTPAIPSLAQPSAATTVTLRPPPQPPPINATPAPNRALIDDAQLDALTERVQRALQRRAVLERGRR